MKKSVAKILIMMLIISTLVGCGKKNDTSETTEATTVETTTETTTETISEETSEVTTEVEATTTEAISTEATESETKDKTEAGTVSDKKTDNIVIDAEKYWADYPLNLSDAKKLYIAKDNNFSFNASKEYMVDNESLSYQEYYNKYNSFLIEDETKSKVVSVRYEIVDSATIKETASYYPDTTNITNVNNYEVTIGSDEHWAVAWAKITENEYLRLSITDYNTDSIDINNYKTVFDFIIK